MNTCKMICVRYPAKREGSRGTRYSNGVAYCKHCRMYMRYEGRYCPCCSCLLRHGPRYMGKKVHAM